MGCKAARGSGGIYNPSPSTLYSSSSFLRLQIHKGVAIPANINPEKIQ